MTASAGEGPKGTRAQVILARGSFIAELEGRDGDPLRFLLQRSDELTTFVGKWNVIIDTPIRKMAAVFDITEADGVLAGVGSNEEESVDFFDIVADGNRLTWSQAVSKPMKLTLKFDVTVDGDAMAGTAKAGIFPASKLEGTRSATS